MKLSIFFTSFYFYIFLILIQADGVLYFSKNDPQILEPDVLSLIWHPLLSLKLQHIKQVLSIFFRVYLNKTDKFNLHKLYSGDAI